jgi:hypothetical protein
VQVRPESQIMAGLLAFAAALSGMKTEKVIGVWVDTEA